MLCGKNLFLVWGIFRSVEEGKERKKERNMQSRREERKDGRAVKKEGIEKKRGIKELRKERGTG